MGKFISRKSIRTIEDKWYGQVFEDEVVERAVAWQYNPVEASSPLGYQPPFWKQRHPSFSNHILTLGVGILV